MQAYKPLAFAFIVLIGCVALKLSIERAAPRPTPRSLSLSPTRASFHSRFLRNAHLGFNSVLADLMWIQFLQVHEHEPVPAGTVSWEYAQLDAVTSLDARFDRAFHYGAILLSVLRQDKLGAKLILERWVKTRPDYWLSNYLYGYHLYFELKDYDLASKYVLRAAGMKGAPYWLSSLGIRLLSESGAILQALQVTAELIATTRDERTLERLVRRMRSLNYHFQKLNWESSLAAFRERHGREPANLEALGADYASRRRGLSSFSSTLARNPSVRALLEERFSFRYDPATKAIVPLKSLEQQNLDRAGIYHPEAN